MKREFMIERNGKAFCLYAGLLDMAHSYGLKSIVTELVQIPEESNRQTAIVRAIVTLENNGIERVFTGIGDAAPDNVAAAMRTCLVRLAETRAKARALRDAVNIGVAAIEELSEEDSAETMPGKALNVGSLRVSRSSSNQKASKTSAHSTRETSLPAGLRTEEQVKAITSICKHKGLDVDTVVRERFEAVGLDTLTGAQAGDLIRSLTSHTGRHSVEAKEG